MSEVHGEARYHNRAYGTFSMWSPDFLYSETGAKGTLDPDEVTALLGIVPSRSHKRGDPRPLGNPPFERIELWPNGAWHLSSKGMIVSDELSDHLVWLLDQLEPVAGKIAAYVSEHDVAADFFCFQSIRGNTVVYMEQRLLRRLSAIGQGIGIDIYCYPAHGDRGAGDGSPGGEHDE